MRFIYASQSKKTLRVGSKVRVRITAVSLGHGISMGKIGVTCRQPYLGALEWIEEDIAKAQKQAKAEAKGPRRSRRFGNQKEDRVKAAGRPAEGLAA